MESWESFPTFGARLQNSFTTELLCFRFFLTAVRFIQNSALRSIVINLRLSIAFHGSVFRWT
jgi:hypothetical protein